MNRVHLWMGLTHPIFGPTNLAWYMANVSMSMSYAAYVTWIQMLMDGPLAAAKAHSDASRGKA